MLSNTLNNSDNVFELAITGYALALTGSDDVNIAISKLADQALVIGMAKTYACSF